MLLPQAWRSSGRRAQPSWRHMQQLSLALPPAFVTAAWVQTPAAPLAHPVQ